MGSDHDLKIVSGPRDYYALDLAFSCLHPVARIVLMISRRLSTYAVTCCGRRACCPRSTLCGRMPAHLTLLAMIRSVGGWAQAHQFIRRAWRIELCSRPLMRGTCSCSALQTTSLATSGPFRRVSRSSDFFRKGRGAAVLIGPGWH